MTKRTFTKKLKIFTEATEYVEKGENDARALIFRYGIYECDSVGKKQGELVSDRSINPVPNNKFLSSGRVC